MDLQILLSPWHTQYTGPLWYLNFSPPYFYTISTALADALAGRVKFYIYTLPCLLPPEQKSKGLCHCYFPKGSEIFIQRLHRKGWRTIVKPLSQTILTMHLRAKPTHELSIRSWTCPSEWRADTIQLQTRSACNVDLHFSFLLYCTWN